MRRTQTRSHFLYWGLLCAALLLFLVPGAQVEFLRARAFSTLTPVLKVCRPKHQSPVPASLKTTIESIEPDVAPAPPLSDLPNAAELAERVDIQAAEIIRLRAELSRIRGNTLLPGVTYAIPRGISAEVIARKSIWQEPFLGLDRGEAEGVQMNAGVLHRGAVLGRIVAVVEHASSVGLLTHPGMNINARLAECRTEGVLRGSRDDTGEQLCRMSVIAREVAAKAGEHVLTSGCDGSFPPGLWLGDVVDVKKTGDAQWEITVRPACSENMVENVHVLTGKLPDVPWPNLPGKKK